MTDDYALSSREKEVRNLVLLGLSNEQISERLYITIKTVKVHLTTIYAKCGVTSRAQLIVQGLKEANEDEEFARLMRELINGDGRVCQKS